MQLFPGIVSSTGVLQVQAKWGRMEESKGWQQKTSRGNRQENGMKESTGYWANGKSQSKEIEKERKR